MSDVMPMCKGCEKLFALLTAERAEHAEEVVNLKRELTRVSCMHSDARTKVINLEQQVADLRKRIAELEAQLQDTQT
jgi:uncharacterized protein YceH (UPF0502 family)